MVMEWRYGWVTGYGGVIGFDRREVCSAKNRRETEREKRGEREREKERKRKGLLTRIVSLTIFNNF